MPIIRGKTRGGSARRRRSRRLDSSDSSDSDEEPDHELCQVCGNGDVEKGNDIVYCSDCGICVHQACYGVEVIPEDDWICSPCSSGLKPQCCLCPHTEGPLKPSQDGRWVHLMCALWTPEVQIGNPTTMEPIVSLDKIIKERWALKCEVCFTTTGTCIQCCHPECAAAFHPLCSRDEGMRMEIVELPGDAVAFVIYCEDHANTDFDSQEYFRRMRALETSQRRSSRAAGGRSASARRPRRAASKRAPLIKQRRGGRRSTPIVQEEGDSDQNTEENGPEEHSPVVQTATEFWSGLEDYFGDIPEDILNRLDDYPGFDPSLLEYPLGPSFKDTPIALQLGGDISDSNRIYGHCRGDNTEALCVVEDDTLQAWVPVGEDTAEDSLTAHIQLLQEQLEQRIHLNSILRQTAHSNIDASATSSIQDPTVMEEFYQTMQQQFLRTCLTRGIGDTIASLQEAADAAACNVCYDGDSCGRNPIVFCEDCNVSVHKYCYGISEIPEGDWFCKVCANSRTVDTSHENCRLCPLQGGALTPCDTFGYVHVTCSLWFQEDLGYEHPLLMQPVLNVDSALDSFQDDARVCCVCNSSKGLLTSCDHASEDSECETLFHPLCAWFKGYYLVCEVSGDDYSLSAFCMTHTPGCAGGDRRDYAKFSQFRLLISHRLRRDGEISIAPSKEIEDWYEPSRCAVCFRTGNVSFNPLCLCRDCGISVHQNCYGLSNPNDWTCTRCKSGRRNRKIRSCDCSLCPRKGGALKPSSDGKWTHISCALWIPEVRFGNESRREPIIIANAMRRTRLGVPCHLCTRKNGACIGCSERGCGRKFHVLCALFSGMCWLKGDLVLCRDHAPLKWCRIPEVSGPYGVVSTLRTGLDQARTVMDLIHKREKLKRALFAVEFPEDMFKDDSGETPKTKGVRVTSVDPFILAIPKDILSGAMEVDESTSESSSDDEDRPKRTSTRLKRKEFIAMLEPVARRSSSPPKRKRRKSRPSPTRKKTKPMIRVAPEEEDSDRELDLVSDSGTSSKYSIGDTVLVNQQEHELMYEGKVQEVLVDSYSDERFYLIHYVGWSKSQDEYVCEPLCMPPTKRNFNKMDKLAKDKL